MDARNVILFFGLCHMMEGVPDVDITEVVSSDEIEPIKIEFYSKYGFDYEKYKAMDYIEQQKEIKKIQDKINHDLISLTKEYKGEVLYG